MSSPIVTAEEGNVRARVHREGEREREARGDGGREGEKKREREIYVCIYMHGTPPMNPPTCCSFAVQLRTPGHIHELYQGTRLRV